MKFCFVILHYKNIGETTKCVSSIQENYIDYKIIIIDNASNDGSGEEIKQLYSSINGIDVIILGNSRGFSHANNIGIKFARKKYDSDFYIVCNNDVQFVDKQMLSKINKIYRETQFSVLGPDIYYIKMAEHQSPFRIEWLKLDEALEEVRYYQNRLNLYIDHKVFFKFLFKIEKCIDSVCLLRMVKNFIYFWLKRFSIYKQHKNMHINMRQYNVCLYGACLIVSRNFFIYFDELFSPETSFYAEEDILLTKCVMKNVKIVYEPCIQVTHTNKGSTFINGEDKYKKMIWRLQQLINSREIYINFLKSLKNEFK